MRGTAKPVCGLERDTAGVHRLSSLTLASGERLEPAAVAYALHGDSRDPLVLVLGGISSGRWIAPHPRAPGGREVWWPDLVGPGRAIDTGRFAVLGIDFLGGCGDSTGPGEAPPATITTGDQASAVAALLDALGVARLHACIGASYGGMVGLALAAGAPDRVERLVVVSAAHESHPMATALRSLQRRAVRLGLRAGRAAEGMAIARGLAMTTYRTAEEFAARFGRSPECGAEGVRFPVDGYLDHHGTEFGRRFSPAGFLCLSESLDLHRVDPMSITVPTTLVAVNSDTLVPPWQMQALARGLAGPNRLVQIDSIYGHDAFLKESAALAPILRHSLDQEVTR